MSSAEIGNIPPNPELYRSCDMARMAATLRVLAGQRVREAIEGDPIYPDHDHVGRGLSIGLNKIDGVDTRSLAKTDGRIE